MQEAFLEAFRSLPTLRDGAKFGPWLAVILHRLAARRHTARSGANSTPVLLSLGGTELLTYLPAPQEDEATAEMQERVWAGCRAATCRAGGACCAMIWSNWGRSRGLYRAGGRKPG